MAEVGRNLLHSITESTREMLGYPASLRRVIHQREELAAPLEELPKGIAATGVAWWHEWGSPSVLRWPRLRRGELMGWRYSCGSYSSFSTERSEFLEFATCEVTEDWSCDIQTVAGLSASKSDLEAFDSLDAMVETNSRPMIEPITDEKLRKNLSHGEIRILQEDPSDYFVRYGWDGRVFLINSGGSHHFAAARYIASRLGISVPLRSKLRHYMISERAVASLRRDFEIFLVNGQDDGAYLDFTGALRDFRATYLWHYLPRPYCDESRAIFLPRSEPRSVKVAQELRGAGFFDLGLHLQALVARQDDHNWLATSEI